MSGRHLQSYSSAGLVMVCGKRRDFRVGLSSYIEAETEGRSISGFAGKRNTGVSRIRSPEHLT